ncbi:MAG: helix-turn-helix domain-containing protein [Actinomycetota bacterium]
MDILRADAVRVLEAVGVDVSEEAVYRFLLERPGSNAAEIARQLGRSAKEIRTMLTHLERKGLVNRTVGRPNQFVPAPPEAAIEVLVLNRQRDLEQARLAAKEMEAAFRATRVRPPSPLEIVEVVLGAEAVDQRFLQLAGGTRQQMWVFDRPPYQSDPTIPNELELELLKQGVSNRALYDTEGLSFPGRIDQLRTLADAGEEARTLPGLPMKLFIADKRLAFIPLSLDEPGMEGALLVQPSPVLDALVTLFETLWERAVPIDLSRRKPQATEQRDGSLSARDEELLVLLVAGLKDRTVAHQLGIAPRTVLRRVANVMTLLGAQTRFQAGWFAAKRGWGG